MPPPWEKRRRRRHGHRHGHGYGPPWHRWRHGGGPRAWFLHAQMRWRVFIWFGLVIALALAARHWVARAGGGTWWSGAAVFAAVWITSGMLAWRLTRPLIAVIDAARRIGDGDLTTRIDPRHHGGELRVLAGAINDMATRIERQLADQRELLAAVSHELRTPLGHMRILIETERERAAAASSTAAASPRTLAGSDAPSTAAASPGTLAELEAEIARLDELVGKLLASSRLDFGHLDRRAIDVGALVADVATQARVDAKAISADPETTAEIDPTLVRRALSNLIDNARIHGGGPIAVRVERRGDDVAIEVDDAGPGVPDERRADAGVAFVPSTAGGLGLGLALVHRIAAAHGGRAWIADRPGGGARVGFALPVTAPVDADPAKSRAAAAPV